MRIRVGDFEIDEAAVELRLHGRLIDLEPLVFRLIVCLARHAPDVVSKDELVDALWGGRAISESALSRAVSLARAALRIGSGANPIQSVYGTGYRLAVGALQPSEGIASVASLAAPRGQARTRRPEPAFVGRKEELRGLREALARAKQGEGGLHLVSGEAGIGKTRLAERLIEIACEDGIESRFGRCAESDGAPSFWPWVQILREQVEAHGPGLMESLGEATARRIERIISAPVDVQVVAPRDRQYSANERFALFDAVTRFLVKASQLRPILIVIDDLHRADRSSLALLQFLAPALGSAHLVVLATYRELDLQQRSRERAEVAEISRAGRAKHYPLAGLEEDDVLAFLGEDGSSPEIAHLLHAKTAGNPLFLGHLAAIVASEPTPIGDRALAGIAAKFPAALRDAIGLQVARLSEPCRALLEVAAVIGRDFDLEALCEAGELAAGRALRLIEEAIDERVLDVLGEDADRRHRFCHVLLREHLYESLSSTTQATYHLRVANVLEARHKRAGTPLLAAIAHHYRSAVPIGSAEPAVEFSMQAGALAQEQSAYEAAAWQYERALASLDSVSDTDSEQGARRCDILLELSGARSRAGDREGARESCRAAVALARALDLPEVLARAAFALSPGFFSIETALYDEELVALLEEALSKNNPADQDTRIRLLSRLATALYWTDQSDRREALSNTCLQLLHPKVDPGTFAYALSARHGALWSPENIDERVGLARWALSIADRLQLKEQALLYRAMLITDLAESGEILELDKEIRKFDTAAASLRQPQSLWLGPMFKGMRALMEGRFEDARGTANEYHQIGNRTQSEDAENAWAGQVFMANFETGLGDQFLPGLEQHVREHPQILIFRAAAVWIKAELGYTDEARAELTGFSEAGFSCVPRDMNWVGIMAFLAMASSELADGETARVLLDRLAPFSSRYGLLGHGTVSLGAIAAHLSRLAEDLGDTEAADRYFAQGRQMNDRVAARPWTTRSLFHRGSALLRRGEAVLGGELLATALVRCRRLGMAHIERKVRAALADAACAVTNHRDS